MAAEHALPLAWRKRACPDGADTTAFPWRKEQSRECGTMIAVRPVMPNLDQLKIPKGQRPRGALGWVGNEVLLERIRCQCCPVAVLDKAECGRVTGRGKTATDEVRRSGVSDLTE